MHAHSGQQRRLREALHRLQHADERLRLTQPRAPVETFPGLPPETPLSLQAVINISDRHLNEEASYILRALSVFPQKPNTFSEEAALAICTRSVEALDTLTDSSLLEVSGQGRYTLHQIIADYARLHLVDMAVEERMVKHFINYVESHELDYDALEMEMNNVLAALQIASKREMQGDLVRGVNAFSRFLITRGSYALGETQLKLAEQAARSLNDRPGLSTALLNLGKIGERRGNYVQAEAYYQEGLTVARQTEDPERISSLLINLGELHLKQQQLDSASAVFQEALHLAQGVDQELVATALYGKAKVEVARKP